MAFDSISEESRGVYVAISPQDGVSSQSDTIGHDSSVLGESRSDVRTGHLEGESSEKSEKTESQDFPRESQKLRNTNPPSAKLHRSGYILCLVVLYVGLAIFAWVVTCYLTFRPITTSHYDLRAGDNSNYNPSESSDPNPLFTRNERWYRVARIIQSIVTVSTIPLTSAVCSSAAVVFIQQRSTKGISMRQVMALADKGWTDLSIYAKTLAFFADDGWKRFGSSFLLLAILVNLLGSVISPLQQLFLSTQTIKIPTEPSWVSNVLDIPDQFSRPSDKDSNLVVAMTRSELTSTTLLERQAQLWQGGNVTCNYKYDPNESKTKLPSSCVYGGATLTNYSELAEPFLAELPSGYNTGLYSQYIPRINSTARYETISKNEFPGGCDKIDGAFFVDYFNATHGDPYWWGLQACMPMNLKKSPWKSTRDRQDFTEEIYLNVTVSEWQQSGSNFYKLMLNTTAGYFELPNYMNGNVAGPLLDKDPNSVCGENCETESSEILPKLKIGKKRRDQAISNDDSLSLEVVRNKGPLLTIAMALFGEGSFIESHQAHPSAYSSSIKYDGSGIGGGLPDYADSCIGLAPLTPLLTGEGGEDILQSSISFCITNLIGSPNGETSIFQAMTDWVSIFNTDEERLTNAFNAAAFVANRAWIGNSGNSITRSLNVNYDLGADTQVPSISKAGLIFTSLLLGLYILVLVPLAIYASGTARWTIQLDSFAMMRIGAAISDKLPLTVGKNTNTMRDLDNISGWVGDSSEEKDPVGRLGLGAARPLNSRKDRRFECDEADKEEITEEEVIWARRNPGSSNI